MNFEDLAKIVEEAGVNVCPICGTPYEKYHSRQRTCGTPECKKAWKYAYLKNRTERLIEEDPKGYRAYRAAIQRKSRERKREKKIAENNLKKMEAYWQSRAAKEDRLGEDGIYYGKRQMEKTLALVPKIDVSGFGKEK